MRTTDGMNLPDFIIIGAMKAGTSAISAFLQQHPQVYLPDTGEVCVFHRDHLYARGLAFYAEFFRDAPEGRLIGEKSPSYIFTPSVPERIAGWLPDVKLLAILRNPVDQALSLHRMLVAKGSERRPFGEAIRTVPDYVEQSRYHAHLSRYLAHFPPEQLKVLWYEDLRTEPEAFCRGVLQYLGADDTILPPLGNNNWTGEARNPAVTRGLHAVYRLRNALRNGPLGRLVDHPALDRRARKLRNRISRWNRRPAPAPTVAPEDRAYIIERLADDIERLARHFNRDLSAWLASDPDSSSIDRVPGGDASHEN